MADPTPPPLDRDALYSRILPTCPASIAEILTHAYHADLAGIKPLLNISGCANVQEPTTGETPLHSTIRGLGDEAAAKAVLEELFSSGAIWNDIDCNNEMPGDVALRMGKIELYNQCVEAGVRAELLFGLLEGYEALESEDEDEVMEDEETAEGAKGQDGGDDEEAPELVDVDDTLITEIVEENPDSAFVPPTTKAGADIDVKSDEYLRSNLTYSDGKLVDSSQNGVMMAWETSIMRASVDALLPPSSGSDPAATSTGRKILNIGFGMGIIDHMFHETQPSKHHIIEAHPEVLAYINGPDCKFGKDWEATGPGGAKKGAYKVLAGKWQDVLPKLLEAGETYDAIYFDTFGENYSQLRMFFTEYVPGLLEQDGRFGFFNGLGADRQICYDVYTKVVEIHLNDAGMNVEWQELDVDMKGLEEDGKGEWEGVKRRYWTLDKYRLPFCTFMG